MESLAPYLDAAILKPEMTREESVTAMKECIALGVKTVCVRPCDITVAKELSGGTSTGVCVVLGFPHGVQLPESKIDEAKRYCDLGVDEIDMVANYGWIRSGFWSEVKADIAGVAEVTKAAGVPLKVIFETACLTPEEIRTASEAAIEAGADFIKTSTGFNGEGARVEDVLQMLKIAGNRAKVKPSGGIRDRETALEFVRMGAARLGVGYAACATLCSGEEPVAGDSSY